MNNGQVVSAGSPNLQVEIDFTNDPTNAVRVWTEVSRYVQAINWTSDGRDDVLLRTSPGTLSATFTNRDGRFDPTNTAGAYYPGVKRKRWIRVTAWWQQQGGIEIGYVRWGGLIDAWNLEWPASGQDATASVTASSALALLNRVDLGGLSYVSQQTGARVAAVLADSGFTAGSIDTGITAIPADGPLAAGTTALQYLLDLEETESGLLHSNVNGIVDFQDRHARLVNTSSTSVQAVIGDTAAPGEIPYRTATLDLDDSDLWNSISVTPAGGTAQTVTDAASIAANYTSRLNRNSKSDQASEALAMAQWLLNRYANTTAHMPSVELLGVLTRYFTGSQGWPAILSATLSSRYTWKRTYAGRTISQDVFLEKVSESVAPGQPWQVAWQFSPALDQVGWRAGLAGFSEAGLTTKAVY